MKSARCAFEVQIFCPLITQLSPSRTARVWSDARSDPEPGSLKPWHQVISSRAMAGRKRAFCSSVPKRMSVGPTRSAPIVWPGARWYAISSL
ncbi:hypothetical protein O0235_04375 [Tepidiforma flava]|uniref:Uncharacterized protein n=1 Tax=Tepidiforma flava TaxID=3004094 RepID=A0ABY7M8D6_9CHLR|nr:hypothetical protein [Tepidiforma flava]WBL36802.1 hypothetical protein O0235_04375 [Tepidiforma flava]